MKEGKSRKDKQMTNTSVQLFAVCVESQSYKEVGFVHDLFM